MRRVALCILVLHGALARAENKLDCEALIARGNMQAAVDGKFDQIELADGWLSHIPGSLKLTAAEGVLFARGAEGLLSAGIGKNLDPQERAFLAEKVKNS